MYLFIQGDGKRSFSSQLLGQHENYQRKIHTTSPIHPIIETNQAIIGTVQQKTQCFIDAGFKLVVAKQRHFESKLNCTFEKSLILQTSS